ncbi:polysaccharide deacetylase family protein [Clostridium sp. YIM B02505]|uniref:Polysaccharide deacetylase family protein n=1 Tax=Clostridium yunnanense TaxID=2800325 RepID=A0ABS1ESV6_9CLOT|nr:polysaccharide deacetylase family protein [Clostridium yunnanense]MBK1812425.1 polysaccharide deacetylase family protein [Clostridium yunnanense]
MNKKDSLLSIVCIIITALIILVVLIGQSLRIESRLVTLPQLKIIEANKNSPIKSVISNDIYSIEKCTFNTETTLIKLNNSTLTTADIGIPILCYHDVNPTKGNDLLLNPDKFRQQMKYLKDNDYSTLTLDELHGYLRENIPIPSKSIVLTFDDGYIGNYTYAFPILKEFGFTATIFMISECVDKDSYLTSNQVKELSEYGIDIESHTTDHSDLTKLSLSEQIDILEKSKHSLENRLNKPVDYIAYPYGKLNNNSKKAAAAAGYKMAFNLEGDYTDKKDNLYNLDRFYIGNSLSMSNFIKIVTLKRN